MLWALVALSVVALLLVRNEFRPSVFLLWSLATVVMFVHAHLGVLL